MESERSTPPDTSRMRLLHAAIQIFSERQFDGASIRDISGLAGINSSQIFFYFRDKEGLYQEALRLACRLCTRLIQALPEPPSPADPDAIPKAVQALQANIRMFVHLGLLPKTLPNAGKLPELEHSALVLLAQGMRYPRKITEEIILESLRPHIDHMTQCIRVIRPDLDSETLFRMGISIHGQLIFFFSHQGIIPLLRGEGYGEASIGSLTEHFTRFSLRGIEVAEPTRHEDRLSGLLPFSATCERNHDTPWSDPR